MKTAPLFLVFLLLSGIVFIQASAKKKNKKPAVQKTQISGCDSVRQVVLSDARNGELKYYYGGFVGASPEVIAQARKMGVRAISPGCMVSHFEECYNQAADSLVYATKKVRLSQLR